MRDHRRGRPGLPALMLAGIALFAACGGGALPTTSPASTPAPTAAATPAPAGASAAASGGAAVQIPLPSGWQQVELTKSAFDAQMKLVAGSNPQMAQMLQQAETSGMLDRMAYYALGYNGSQVIGNINVIKLPLEGATVDAVVPSVEGQFKQLGATDVTSSQTTILGASVPVIAYSLDMAAGSSSVSLAGRAYLVPVGSDVYDVTLSCYGSDASCLQQGDQAIHGMTVGP